MTSLYDRIVPVVLPVCEACFILYFSLFFSFLLFYAISKELFAY